MQFGEHGEIVVWNMYQPGFQKQVRKFIDKISQITGKKEINVW